MTESSTGKILARDLSLVASRAVRDVGRPALREVVEECTRVFLRCSNTGRGTDEHIGQLFPLLQLAEHLDGIEVLLDAASNASSTVLLRAAFESLLAVEWVAEEPSLRYGAAYVVSDIHRRIAGLEQFTPGNDRRRQAEDKKKGDTVGARIEFPTFTEAPAMIARLRELLKAAHLKEAAAEYALQRKRPNKIEWFAFWGGPRSVEQLATRLVRVETLLAPLRDALIDDRQRVSHRPFALRIRRPVGDSKHAGRVGVGIDHGGGATTIEVDRVPRSER